MMFEQNFMPEGAEINPDTPRKKGLALPSGWAACRCACWRRSPPGGWWVRL